MQAVQRRLKAWPIELPITEGIKIGNTDIDLWMIDQHQCAINNIHHHMQIQILYIQAESPGREREREREREPTMVFSC